MRIPTVDSMNRVIEELNETDYTEPNSGIKSEVEFYESEPVKGLTRTAMNKIMKNNYAEPSKKLQDIYESQFRSFSRNNDKCDSFDNLI